MGLDPGAPEPGGGIGPDGGGLAGCAVAGEEPGCEFGALDVLEADTPDFESQRLSLLDLGAALSDG
jgi:hypothetical protein